MFREFRVKRTLRRLAKQRVSAILQPGNVWVIENALSPSEDLPADIQTCVMRGWIEILHDDVPTKKLPADLSNLSLDGARPEPIYRLTDCGCAEINRNYVKSVLSVLAGVISVVAIFK